MKKVYVPFYKELLNCFLKKVCICHSCTAVPHPYQHLGIARFGGWFVCFGFGHSSHRIDQIPAETTEIREDETLTLGDHGDEKED